MKLLRNLVNVTFEEQKEFLMSFKHVLCDMDGVIWLFYQPIPGAAPCIDALKNIDKNITFITNNALNNVEHVRSRLVLNQIREDVNIINPAVATVAYLKKINFNQQAFCITSQAFKDGLRNAGFSVAPESPQIIEEDVATILQNVQDDPKIGAVILDFDMNMTRLKLQKALTYLKRKDCHFIVGARDKILPIGVTLGPLIGIEHFAKALTDISGREFIQLAKPSKEYAEYIKEELKLNEPSSVLCIGDSIPEDMGFATRGGFQKLLVLTGLTKKEDLQDWKYPEEFKPQYYVESLNDLRNILTRVFEI